MSYQDSKLFIETKRLILRPFTLNDIDDAHIMNLDEEVSRYTGDGGKVSKEEIASRISEDVLGDYKKHGFGRLAVELKEKSTFIGFAGLKYLEDMDEVDLGYRFMSKYWGKGLATEAGKASIEFGFNALKLNRIIAMVLPKNIASIKVLEKLNFQYERSFSENQVLINLFSISQKE